MLLHCSSPWRQVRTLTPWRAVSDAARDADSALLFLQLLPLVPAGLRESQRGCCPGWLGACPPCSLRMHGRGVEGLLGCGSQPVVTTRPVLAAGSGAGDGAGLHPCPGGGRHHRQEGAAHQTALPFRQRLHQGDLPCLPPGPRWNCSAPSPPCLCSQAPRLAGVGAFSLWLLALLSSPQKSFQFPGEGGGGIAA